MNPDWKELDQQVTAAGQLRPEDVAHIAAAGFRAVICNRPDGEEPGQTDFNEIAQACAHNGLRAHYIPQADRAPTDYAITRFDEVMQGTQGKVFAFCRSGARCEAIWTGVKRRRAGAGR